MKLFLFHNSGFSDFFFQGRFLGRKLDREIKLATVQFEKRGKNEDLDKLKKQVDAQKPTPKKQLDSLKKDTDRRNTVQKTEKRLEKKHGEKMDPYKDNVEKAFDALKKDPSKLYDFLMSCKIYEKVGHYKSWNEKFTTLLGLPLKTGNPAEKEYAMYAGAVQIYLQEKVFKENIFSYKEDKKSNVFVRIDDKIGAYTVSVLTAYWNQHYARTKFTYKGVTKVHGPLGYASLHESYSDVNKKVYKKALDDLTRKLKMPVSKTEKEVQKLSFYQKHLNEYTRAYETAIKKNPNRFEHLFGYVGGESFQFQAEFERALALIGEKENSAPANFDAWLKLFKKANADLEILVPGYRFRDREVSVQKKAKQPEKRELSPEERKRKKLIDAFAAGVTAYRKTFWNKHNSQYEDYIDSLQDLAASDYKPEILTDLDDYPDSWVGKVNKEYEALYKRLPGTALSKKNDPELKKLYDRIWQTVKDYHRIRWNALQEFNRLYRQKARRMVNRMDLPEGFSKIDYTDSFFTETNSMAIKFRGSLLRPRELWRDYVRKQVMTRYFNLKDVPTRTFKNWDELAGKVKKGFLDSVTGYFGNGNKEAALKMVNDVILFNNLEKLRGSGKDSLVQLRLDYQKDLGRVMKFVDSKYNLYRLKGLKFTEETIKTEIRKRVEKG